MAPVSAPVWRTLATALDAGMGLEAVLATPSSTWPPPLVAGLRRGARTGRPGEALRQAGLLDDGAAALLDAGAQGGFLPSALRGVADLIEEAQQRRRRLLLAVAYPAAVLICACVLLPLPAIVTGGVGAWAETALPGLGAVVGVLTLVFVVVPRLPPTTQQSLRALLARVPLAGGLVLDDARATGLGVLARLLSAGMSVDVALPLAARGSGLPTIAARGDDGVARLTQGATLVDALDTLGLIDASERGLLAVAETSGRLDVALADAARRLQERARGRFLVLAGGIAVVVGIGVAILVGVQIVRGFVGYVDTIDAITR